MAEGKKRCTERPLEQQKILRQDKSHLGCFCMGWIHLFWLEQLMSQLVLPFRIYLPKSHGRIAFVLGTFKGRFTKGLKVCDVVKRAEQGLCLRSQVVSRKGAAGWDIPGFTLGWALSFILLHCFFDRVFCYNCFNFDAPRCAHSPSPCYRLVGSGTVPNSFQEKDIYQIK